MVLEPVELLLLFAAELIAIRELVFKLIPVAGELIVKMSVDVEVFEIESNALEVMSVDVNRSDELEVISVGVFVTGIIDVSSWHDSSLT